MLGKAIVTSIYLLCLFSFSTLSQTSDSKACLSMLKEGLRPIDEDRTTRFLGKVAADTAQCRGGEKALKYRHTPWADWSHYWSTGDITTKKEGSKARTILGEHLKPNGRGIDGALMDLEYQRIELIKFNLFDNHTYEQYIKGRGNVQGPAINVWPEMRLPENNKHYQDVGGATKQQLCKNELIRYRTLTGICNDIYNPKMGSTGTLFARNAQFSATFPRLNNTDLALARHSDDQNGMRINLLTPNPQLISRKLFTRQQQNNDLCQLGLGNGENSTQDNCDYQKAPFFNVLAAFWIQFMTHDWFLHLNEGHNERQLAPVGCDETNAEQIGCRAGDRMEPSLYAQTGQPESFEHKGEKYLKRAYKTTSNNVTAWWDASQIYGFDETSKKRVIRDPIDSAKLLQKDGYLPTFDNCDVNTDPNCAIQPHWQGQEAVAFPDNWSIGLSFYHNVFVREHNKFVENFRQIQVTKPNADSGLRNPLKAEQPISYKQVTNEELYQIARLVVSAEIAKIHTIEWTTQLLYNDPLYRGMNSNWFGLFNLKEGGQVSNVVRKITGNDESLFSRSSDWLAGVFGEAEDSKKHNSLYSVFASGAGIFGLQNKKEEGFWLWRHDAWDLNNPKDVNGGINHFGSPFNFPEEFTSVYRLHPLVPDLIEYREWQTPNTIKEKIPVMNTVRAAATEEMRSRSLENWTLSMGRQRLGLLHLQNHPMFLQNLDMPHLNSPSGKLDIVALDIIRDRERGVPRFNEFRRQIGLKTLTSFNDFIDQRLPDDSPSLQAQTNVVNTMREIYGTHICDNSKVISDVQLDDYGQAITDCLGHPDGSVIDNIEDVDLSVGWLAEYTRPHGFAISETQFHIFILNASRRLFSDRFFTSSFRPEFYSNVGVDWVNNNGMLSDCPFPLEESSSGEKQCNEPRLSNGEKVPVSPMKRLLMRNIPQLHDELLPVVNAFDPWARDRGEYYSLEWKPRADAKSDPSFK